MILGLPLATNDFLATVLAAGVAILAGILVYTLTRGRPAVLIDPVNLVLRYEFVWSDVRLQVAHASGTRGAEEVRLVVTGMQLPDEVEPAGDHVGVGLRWHDRSKGARRVEPGATVSADFLHFRPAERNGGSSWEIEKELTLGRAMLCIEGKDRPVRFVSDSSPEPKEKAELVPSRIARFEIELSAKDNRPRRYTVAVAFRGGAPFGPMAEQSAIEDWVDVSIDPVR